MEKISEEIVEKLSPIPVFELHIAGHDLVFTNSVVNSWLVMAVIVLVCILLTRNLQIVPKGPQIALEWVVNFINNFFTGTLGHHGKPYIPYLGSVLIFLIFSNTIGFFGFTPPTKDINVTASLALMSVVLIQMSGIRAHGVFGWVKSFSKPVAIVTPINILEIGIQPLSLCMRLFGNVLGAFIIMELLKCVCAWIVPQVFSCYFDLFDGAIQAYVFVFLTSMFMSEKME